MSKRWLVEFDTAATYYIDNLENISEFDKTNLQACLKKFYTNILFGAYETSLKLNQVFIEPKVNRRSRVNCLQKNFRSNLSNCGIWAPTSLLNLPFCWLQSNNTFCLHQDKQFKCLKSF